MKVIAVTLESSTGQVINLTSADTAMGKAMTVLTPSGEKLTLPPSDVAELARFAASIAPQA